MEMSEVLVTDEKEIERIRKYYRRFFSSHYLGWSDKFDKQFDKNSEWFCLYADDHYTIRSMCRVTYKNDSELLPIMLGDASISIDGDIDTCEINNFTYKKTDDAVALVKLLTQYLKSKGVELAYCIVDGSEQKAFVLNTQVFGFEPTNYIVEFKDIRSRLTGGLITWKVLYLHKKAA